MIKPDSIFYRLPTELDRKQALFLDGIRHAAEIAQLAYRRLQHTLTKIATNDDTPKSSAYAAAYLDAWSFVDAVDRFRLLLELLPNFQPGSPPSGQKSFFEVAAPVRQLRNVADHLAQRADYVVARQGTALGSLSWFTVTDLSKYQGLLCVVVPGTTQVGSHPAKVPAGKIMDVPTGYIHLTAGEHMANLSEVFGNMSEFVAILEASLERSISAAGLQGSQAGADLIIKANINFRPPSNEA